MHKIRSQCKVCSKKNGIRTCTRLPGPLCKLCTCLRALVGPWVPIQGQGGALHALPDLANLCGHHHSTPFQHTHWRNVPASFLF